MKRLVRTAVVLLAAIPATAPAGAAAPPPAPGEAVLEGWVYAIDTSPIVRGTTPPPGTIVTRRSLGAGWRFAYVGAYLRTELDGSLLAGAGGRWCLLRGVLHDGEIRVGGSGTQPLRTFDVFDVKDLRAFDDPWALRPAMRGSILRDLFRRGVDYGRDGTQEPEGGLSPDGRLDDGRRARRVPLVTPPYGSADMFSETAWVDPRARRYWAVRTGGFAGVVQWVGPFELPRRRRAAH
jgi:hypothetical protein